MPLKPVRYELILFLNDGLNEKELLELGYSKTTIRKYIHHFQKAIREKSRILNIRRV